MQRPTVHEEVARRPQRIRTGWQPRRHRAVCCALRVGCKFGQLLVCKSASWVSRDIEVDIQHNLMC
jgi:hypothetical protein